MNPILAFIATAYGLSVALSLVVGLTGGYGSPLIGLRYLSMFLPGIAMLIVDRATDESPTIRFEFPFRYLPVALFLIPGVLHAVMLPTMTATEGLQWQDWLTPQSDGLYHTPASRGWGTLTVQGLASRIAVNAIFGLIVVSFLAFFEEVGWRAWLLPRLRARMGARRAVVLTATIWALWHVPFQLSGIQHIDGVSPMRLAIGFPFGIMAAGLVIGWLWLRTESVWLCAIAHGALNNWGQYAFKYMKDAPATDADLLVLAVGFLACLSLEVSSCGCRPRLPPHVCRTRTLREIVYGRAQHQNVAQSMRVVVSGLLAGVAAAFGLARVLEGLLFGVTPHDPLVFISVPVLLITVAFVAVWLSSQLASRVDPIVALRAELRPRAPSFRRAWSLIRNVDRS